MRHAFYLALRSLRWYRGRAITIVLCLALTLWLPVTVRLLLNQFREEITLRADTTPLVVGARGSRIDLALHALYFDIQPPAMTSAAEADAIQQSGLANAVPLHIRYQTQSRNGWPGVPIVGTSPEYFEFRRLRVAEGRPVALLGECMVGAEAARRLNLRPGDSILSAPRNAFNLAGDYPLKLNVTGILEPSYSSDDDVVFTDTRTVWVIDGIGHGHQDLTQPADDALLLSRDRTAVTASAAVLPYTEITAANVDSFHFHGEPENFPLTAVLAIPDSEKSRTLLLGRYASGQRSAQCLKPPEVVDELLSVVFRIEQLVWISSLVATSATALLLGLVLSLSLRLRAAEMQTMFRLGCSRFTVVRLLASEVVLMLAAGTTVALLAARLTQELASESMRQFLF